MPFASAFAFWCNPMNRLSRRAPAVRYPLRRSTAFGWGIALVVVAGAAVLIAWALLGAHKYHAGVIAATCFWAFAAAGAYHFWQRQWIGFLGWDGRAWTMDTAHPQAVSWTLAEPPEVLLDLQTHVWLYVSCVERRRAWLWLDRSSHPERWMDLRRAVYSRAASGTDNAEENAPASNRAA